LCGYKRASRAGYFGEERQTPPVWVVEEGGFSAGDVDEDLNTIKC